MKRRLTDWLLSALLVLLPLVTLRASLHRAPTTFDAVVLRVTGPLASAVEWLVTSLGGIVQQYVALVDVERENSILREENRQLTARVAQLSPQALRAAELESLLRVQQQSEADLLVANVISAPLTSGLAVRLLHIDRGAKDVVAGMPVLAGSALLGRIVNVSDDYAQILLISDPASSVDVLLPRTQHRGILSGTSEPGHRCRIEWVETTEGTSIQVGDEVATSGLGASFPAGLPVGKVTRIGARQGLFVDLEVTPIARPESTRLVFVIAATKRPDMPTEPAAASPIWGMRAY